METATVTLDCRLVNQPDLGAIDRIARFHVVARRADCDLRLVNATRELLQLIRFAGLSEVLRIAESERQIEERENPRRVEEEGQLVDPAV
jgi:hypothetical protein